MKDKIKIRLLQWKSQLACKMWRTLSKSKNAIYIHVLQCKSLLSDKISGYIREINRDSIVRFLLRCKKELKKVFEKS